MKKQIIEGVLKDGCEGHSGEVKVKVEIDDNGIWIFADGYGEAGAAEGFGNPAFVEFYEGELRLLYSPDINVETPEAISLEGARESCRKEDANED